ncbi:hypothetical protein V2J09_002000 [Rumex salicifolius]
MNSGAELILFSDPEMGHLLAEVELGRRLISLDAEISIAILIPKLPVPNDKVEAFIKSLNVDLSREPNQRISLIELPPIADIPPESIRIESHVLMVDCLAGLYKPIVKKTIEDRRIRCRTAGIVFDMFCSPMVDVAEELGVPSYLFYSSGANMLTMTLHLESLSTEDLPALYGGLPPESTPVNFLGFKNPVPLKVWPKFFLNKGKMSLWEHFLRFATNYRKATGILVNTFSEMETGLLKALNDDEQIPPVYSVGPIINFASNRTNHGDGVLTELPPRDPVLSWLDEQPLGSVVFLCFGSKIGSFEKAQVDQLAAGIEKSGHRFLWSIRDQSDDVFPDGFLDRTAGKGKVIGWAPQTDVLGHVAVGAFVSHCGWNSTLESLWFGVPLVAWPMYAEQQLNAFTLVTELGLAVDIKLDYQFDMINKKGSVVVDAAEIEAAIRRVMGEEKGAAELRKKTKEMSELARKASEMGGSSYKSLSLFLESFIKNLLLFAAPDVGHLLSAVEFGRRLVAVNSQISMVILIPKLPVPNEKVDAFVLSLDADLRRDSNCQRISLVELPPLDPKSSDSGNPSNYFPLKIESLTTLCKPAVKRVVEDRRRHRKIAGIVFDMFCTPMVDVAEELGVPSYLFYTSGADMLTFTLRMESLGEADLPSLFDGMSPDSTPVKFSGFRNPVPLNVWPDVYLNKQMSLCDTFLRFASQYRKAKGILVNTFSELESDLLKSLSKDENVPPVYPVGPILHLSREDSTEKPRDPVLSWLDLQPAGSVVFFCFGSKVSSFEKVQVEKLAEGIERSGHRFLWSIRAPLDEVLPEGFLDRTAGIGKVTGWAPQTEVLGHVAVGAFVSHCGWNSTIESLWFGVPLVTWPLYAEQQLNAFMLVRDLGLAVELKMDYKFDMMRKKGSTVVEAAEVEAAIRKMMEEEEGMAVRKKTKEISELARKAMEVGGSSYKSLSLYLEDVMKNV